MNGPRCILESCSELSDEEGLFRRLLEFLAGRWWVSYSFSVI